MDKRLLTLLLVCMCATLGIQARTVKGTVVDKTRSISPLLVPLYM